MNFCFYATHDIMWNLDLHSDESRLPEICVSWLVYMYLEREFLCAAFLSCSVNSMHHLQYIKGLFLMHYINTFWGKCLPTYSANKHANPYFNNPSWPITEHPKLVKVPIQKVEIRKFNKRFEGKNYEKYDQCASNEGSASASKFEGIVTENLVCLLRDICSRYSFNKTEIC